MCRSRRSDEDGFCTLIKYMKSLLIKDTTLEERKQIVQESLSFGASDCDGVDLSDLYDDYIQGFRELADINAEFSAKHAGEVVAGDLNKPSCSR